MIGLSAPPVHPGHRRDPRRPADRLRPGPGHPRGRARAVLGTKATPPAIAQFNVLNGFDLPLWDQFYQYLLGLLPHNLGYSYTYNQGVWPRDLETSAQDAGARRDLDAPGPRRRHPSRDPPGGPAEKPSSTTSSPACSFVFYAMPAFLLGTLLILCLRHRPGLVPGVAPEQTVGRILADPRALVLPVITLAAITIASFSRYMRSSMMEAMTEDYVRTARAKGAGPAGCSTATRCATPSSRSSRCSDCPSRPS